MLMTHIYSLSDPVSGTVRYVGKTNRDPSLRFRVHLSINRQTRTYKQSWITNLKTRGLRPQTEIIASVPEDRGASAERIWIGFYRWLGYPLVNHSAGGESGFFGGHHTKEAKQRISDGLRGKKPSALSVATLIERNKLRVWTSEMRDKMSQSRPGYRATLETKEKMSAALRGRIFSDDHKRRLSEAAKSFKRGSLSESHRLAISRSLKGKPLSESHKRAMRHPHQKRDVYWEHLPE